MVTKFHYGADRRDIGLMKAAVFIGSCFAKIDDDFDQTKLLPNVPDKPPQTPQEALTVLQAATRYLQWQPSPSER